MIFKKTFFSQLQTLICAGLSFSQAFEFIIDTAGKKEKGIYDSVFAEVVSGKELWRSMEACPEFTDLDRSVIRIGEETGRLTDALGFLSEYYRKKEVQARMLKNALSYPVIILTVAIIVLIFMVLVVVPMFE